MEYFHVAGAVSGSGVAGLVIVLRKRSSCLHCSQRTLQTDASHEIRFLAIEQKLAGLPVSNIVLFIAFANG